MPASPLPEFRRVALLVLGTVAASAPPTAAVAVPAASSTGADRAFGVAIAELADPFLLMQKADRRGHVAVPRLLRDQGAPVLARLGAMRAAPFVDLPPAALLGLATLAGGRDPDLAPAAAAALRTMSIDPSRPPGAPGGPPPNAASLAGFSRVIQGVEARESVRPDLRRALSLARLAWDGSGWL